MTISDLLRYLVSGGAVVLAAAFCSWAGENLPRFQALSAGAKQAVMVVACLALALGAYAVQTYVPAETLAALAAPFGIVMLTLAALLGNQFWHKLVNKANPTLASEPLAPLVAIAANPGPGPA